MVKSSLRLDVVLASLIVLAAGCERSGEPARQEMSKPSQKAAESQVAEKDSATGQKPQHALPEEPLTPDQVALKKAKSALDDGDIHETMKIARGLIDSKDAEVRSSIVDMFRWVGKKALPELAEMLNDKDPRVAAEAFDAWEFALQDVSHDFVKVSVVTNVVARMDNPVVIESALMHIVNMELRYSLPALEGLVVGCRGKTCGQCAKRMFEHIAGEPWASPERTRAILKQEGGAK